MFLQYMREDADDDDNSKRPAGVNRVRSVAEGQAGPAQAQEGPKMTVLIYVNTSKQVGDADHLKVFANVDAADTWFEENDPEGVAFGYEVLGDETRPRSYCPICGVLIDMRDLSQMLAHVHDAKIKITKRDGPPPRRAVALARSVLEPAPSKGDDGGFRFRIERPQSRL